MKKGVRHCGIKVSIGGFSGISPRVLMLIPFPRKHGFSKVFENVCYPSPQQCTFHVTYPLHVLVSDHEHGADIAL